MPLAISNGTLLIAPHQFPHLERELALANQFGLELVAAADQQAFTEGMTNAVIVMVTPYGKVNETEFSGMTRCKAVVRYGMGYDNIDVNAANRLNIPVSIVPDASSEEVAAHALAMGIALARRLPQGQASIERGGWAGTIAYDTPKLANMDVGIVGMGRIGRLTAGWWAALGTRVKAYDPYATFDNVTQASLEEVLEQSDVVSLHLPLNADTRNMINAAVLKRMRKGSVIINVSRGGLIDEPALAAALHEGHIAGAALDVFAKEPLPADNALRNAPNVILTPHIAWRSNTSLGALQDGAVERARRALVGEVLPDVVS
ncbi:hydroxyacid dehydrogenase [Pseudomonas ogarae]|jgi:D-3-phosphoglycerate dehydrogenase|uniref:Hydroxyacid dehydrogenase n=1 Tax=Pseudomonas kilonensis TaxID=132476 RepID=A0A0F4XX19_9PSED|nr:MULTISPECIES: C-terminal binding protein [Pseudomonas]KKA09913.1 hydroxyacid dehydrogenase [Pseudomonas ogarae]MBO1537138.1 C-terminal binding protein [Pseudomonas sp. OA65]